MTDLTKHPSPPQPDMASAPSGPIRMAFTASGSEYFRIWIVNLLLTIVTLGIYSAWAKVRRTRYFYDNTKLDDSSFEYHGNPIAILKGRIIALVLFGGYNLTIQVYPKVGLAIFALLMVVMPWLAWKSLQFKLYNSSYRGIRFGFRGSLGKAYKAFLLMPVVAAITLYLGLPYAHQRMKKFQHEESRYGNTYFSFDAPVGAFYRMYVIGFAIFVAGTVVISIVFGAAAFAIYKSGGDTITDIAGISTALIPFIIALYVWMFMLFPLFLTMSHNLIWSHTKLGQHQFASDMKWTRMTFIVLTNLLGIICTLGLFIPFAHVRAIKYMVESTSVVPAGSLDQFHTAIQADVSATGEGMSDLLDFDLSL
jgi:uncharacterized membrane protein YjgN (DUF898 family)